MENEKTSEKSVFQIDTFEILKILNRSRRFIIKITLIFFVLGIIIAVLSTKEYTSSSSFIPQISSDKGLGKKLSGLASLVGVNVGGESGGNVVLPTQYPLIVESTPFKKELLASRIPAKGQDSTVSISYYLENVKETSFLNTIKGYTIGLPGKVMGAFSSSEVEEGTQKRDTSLYYLTNKEQEQLDYLYSKFSVNINDTDGYIEIQGTLPEAKASAKLVNNIQALLQKFIIEYNIQKSQQELKYINKRFSEVEKDYFDKRAALARYKDRNVNVISNLAQNRLEQLQTEYSLSSEVYSQLAGEQESAKLTVKKDTPVFTVLKPATVPLKPSAPKKVLIVLQFLIVGFIIGAFIVLFRYFYPFLKSKISN